MEQGEFTAMRKELRVEVDKSFNSLRTDNVKSALLKWKVGNNGSRRSALEQVVKEKVLEELKQKKCKTEYLETMVELILTLCREELVSSVLSVVILGDIFDSTTLDVCEKLFSFVESNVSTWKEPLFFSSCKNNILRMCNDLLRRLSKSQNTVFCGRILLFLAMFFPFSERSGLNIVSEFNVDNVTKFGGESGSDEAGVNSLDEIISEASLKIDYNFYVKFWSIQDFFRSPYQCYNKLQWKEFVSNSGSVLSVFKNFKVDPDPNMERVISHVDDEQYFAKFLTNQKLLVLQLNDVNFRRTIYLQFLILFQFLSAHVKSKPESFELKPEQAEWVKETTELIHQLIRESPPEGDKFLEIVLKLFERDEQWNSWKNDGCPELTVVGSNLSEPVKIDKPLKRKRTLGDICRDSVSNGRIIVAREEGHRVFETRGESLKFCSKRLYRPNLHTYMEEAIQQSDPAAMIEPQFKKISKMRYSWSALRLLAMKCPHYFAVTQNPVSKIPDFLESMCRKIAKDQTMAPSKSNTVTKPYLDHEAEQMVVEVDRENGDVEVQVKRETDSDTDTKDSKEKEAEDEEDDVEEEDDEEDEEEEDEEEEEEEAVEDREDEPENHNHKDKTNGLHGDGEQTLKKELLEEVGTLVASSWQNLAQKLGYQADEIEYFASVSETEEGRSKNMLSVWASNEDGATPRNLQRYLNALLTSAPINGNESSIREAIKRVGTFL